MPFPYYAVARGRKPGIYTSWEQCKIHTDKFNGAKFKGFVSKEEAQIFINKFSTLKEPVKDKPNETVNDFINQFSSISLKDTHEKINSEKVLDEQVEDSDFEEEENLDEFISVFIDGVKPEYRIFWNKNNPMNLIKSKEQPSKTPLAAEIETVTKTVIFAKKQGITKLRIHTNSISLIHCIKE